ncbi:MAG: hypothetical protein JXA11_11400 [Phycisphaerae bacterium]|nr:hypothetical protein [Phycisphaerae bacterium]
MKLLNWKVVLGAVLLLLSAACYLLHYLLFHDAHHIYIYLVGDIAFVFVEVLLVTMVIHHLLNEWEKKSKLKKLNMVIETFFSEFGKPLLAYLSKADRDLETIRPAVVMNCDGTPDFKWAVRTVGRYDGNIDVDKVHLHSLGNFLHAKRGFLVNLLQNPNLLEHETFSESLMALFHITEELNTRDLDHLSEEDRQHTKRDLERAYGLLIRQWVSYMKYTHAHFPYFFLFAMNTNPFDAEAPWSDRWSEKVHESAPELVKPGME